MSEADDFLAHYGVKGMRWGVKRKLMKMTSSKDRQTYLDTKDAKWLEKAKSDKKIGKVTRRTNRRVKKMLPGIRANYTKSELLLSPTKKAQYQGEVKAAFEAALEYETHRAYRNSPSRTRQVRLEPQRDGSYKAIVEQRENAKLSKQRGQIAKADVKRQAQADKDNAAAQKMKHSDLPEDDDPFIGMVAHLLVDADGFVTDIVSPLDDDLSHSELLEEYMDDVDADMDDFLEHVGVKGMRWGVRKGKPSGKAKAGQPRKAHPAEESSNNKQGPKHPDTPHGNAPRRASEMSTQELQSAINRINLEKQYAQLTATPQARTRAEKAGELTKQIAANAAKKAIQKGADAAADVAVNALLNKLTDGKVTTIKKKGDD